MVPLSRNCSTCEPRGVREAGLEGFSIEDLIDCYRRGVFPMADARHDRRVFLVDPARRGVLPLDGFHISRRLARALEVRADFRRIDPYAGGGEAMQAISQAS